MPTRFTAEQLAASATAGEPRTEDSFGGDRDAWHAYQAEWFATITLGDVLPPVSDNNRAKRWKAARRQRGKIEAQREKAQNENARDAARKRLKLSDQWVAAHVPALRELQAHSPVATPGGKHATRRLSALVATPEGAEREYSEQVCYTLPPPATASRGGRWSSVMTAIAAVSSWRSSGSRMRPSASITRSSRQQRWPPRPQQRSSPRRQRLRHGGSAWRQSCATGTRCTTRTLSRASTRPRARRSTSVSGSSSSRTARRASFPHPIAMGVVLPHGRRAASPSRGCGAPVRCLRSTASRSTSCGGSRRRC